MRPASPVDTADALVDFAKGDWSAATVEQPLMSGVVPTQNSAVATRFPGFTVPFTVAEVEPTDVADATVTTGADTTDMVKTFESSCGVASVTFTVNVDSPATVGFPDTVPLFESRFSPAGKDPPITDQV